MRLFFLLIASKVIDKGENVETMYECISRHSAGNLHVDLQGDFNGMCAWELLKLLKQNGSSKRVFVNTAGLDRVAGEGVRLFKKHMTCRRMQPDWLYFKGEKGFKIAPDGSRVLICRKEGTSMSDRSDKKRGKLRVVKTIDRLHS